MRYITYNRLIVSTVLLSILLGVAFTLVYGYYIKQEAINELAHKEAKKTSAYIFETVFTAMERGATKEELHRVVERLNALSPEMEIKLYRSEKIAALFGDSAESVYARKNDSNIQRAFKGEEVLETDRASTIRYSYPILVEQKCLQCHNNVDVGDVNGVIDITMPIQNLQVSLSTMLNSLIIFFIFFLLVVFSAIYYSLNHNLVKPLELFLEMIKAIMENRDYSNRVKLATRIIEIKDIEEFFNQLLASLERQFFNDNLTKLPNRRKLVETLESSGDKTLAIFNIDRFNEVNDFYGHHVGDEILTMMAERIKATIEHDNLSLFRVAGDEFAILSQHNIDLGRCEIVVERLISLLHQKFVTSSGYEININVSVGISHNADNMLAHADMALKSARAENKPYVIYHDNLLLAQAYENNIKWSRVLKEAVESENIIVHYQPIIDNATGKISKYETLMRLQEGDRVISPALFLDIAKKNRIYPKLTKRVVELAFETFASRNEEFSINLSVEDIQNSELIAMLYHAIAAFPDKSRIVFELVESEGIENYEEVKGFIDHVKAEGAKVAVDDFGTGYSNFEYLMRLNVDYIKIDAAMIKNIDHDENSQVVTQTIVQFAKRLGVKTIAEFVHSQSVYDKVRELGVDYSQGYHLGAPKAQPLD